jgi:hypothetical protein
MSEERKPDDAPDAVLVAAVVEHARRLLATERDEAAFEAVRQTAERHLKQAAKLRAYPLKNSDEPDFTFRPYRAEG